MPTDTRQQLRDLGDELRRSSTPITFDEIATPTKRTASDVVSITRSHRRDLPRRPRARWAAVAAVAAATVGLFAIANRPGSEQVAEQPAAVVLPVPMAPAGSMILGTELPGWELQRVSSDGTAAGSGDFVRRIYIADDPHPENAPALIVDSFDADAGSPYLDPSTRTTTVRGTTGYLFDREPNGHGLAFESDGYWFDITIYNLPETDLIAAATAVVRSSDGYGATIDAASRPADLVDEAEGVQGESWFVSRSAFDHPIPDARWENDDQSIWFQSFQQDPTVDRFQRVGAATVVDTTVNGQPAFLRTLPDNDEYRSITWHAVGRTNVLGSMNVDEDELVDFATALRPATVAEWDAAVASVAPPVACVGPECDGAPEPGSIVPAGVESFPTIDESVVPGDGQRSTLAQYSYFGYSDSGASTWTGVIGVPSTNTYDNLITVTVAPSDEAEPLPVEPGRTSDIGEHDYGNGVELVKTLANDIVVIVGGRDIDQLYQVLDNIAPTMTDGALTGYKLVGDLPGDLTELEPPFERGIASGSFPHLQVNGNINISVSPLPALLDVSGWIGPVEQLDTSQGPALFYQQAQTGYAGLAITLNDGTTLSISGRGNSREQLVELAAEIQLVDEQSWTTRYNPILATITGATNTPATTEIIDQTD